MSETIQQGRPLAIKVRFLKKSGQAVLCKLTGTPVYNNDGSFKYSVLTARDISEQRKEKEELEYLAYHDFLTNIPNRRKFDLEIDKAFQAWKNKGEDFALFLLDIDHFKKINDNWGHDMGDIILIEVGERLSNNIRAKDTLARFGGDEFALIIRNVDTLNKVKSVAKSLRTLFDKNWDILPRDLQVYTSIGVSWTGFYEENTVDALRKDADIALYESKKEKGNVVKIHSYE